MTSEVTGSRRWVGAVLAAVLLTPLLAVATLSGTGGVAGATPPVGTVESFAAGAGLTDVREPTAGPDGNTWFVSPADHAIGRITPAGVVTVFTDPVLKQPVDIVTGSDGNLWFVDRHVTYGLNGTVDEWGYVGRMTPTGDITVFRHDHLYEPASIVAGPDGNLWYTDDYGDLYYVDGSTGVVTTDGDITVLDAGDENWYPTEIVFSSTGVPWTTSRDTGHIGTGSATGMGPITYTEDLRGSAIAPGAAGSMYVIGTRDMSSEEEILRFSGSANVDAEQVDAIDLGAVDPVDLVDLLGMPEGVVWFADAGGSVGRIAPDGDVAAFPTAGATPDRLAKGPDGNVWFVDGDTIGRVTAAGDVDLFDAPYPIASGPDAGGDANLWFTDGESAIGRVVVTPDGVPVSVQAVAGRQRATVSWQAPPTATDPPVSGYQITASPGGATCSTNTTSCVVVGLTENTPYTFTAKAVGLGGPGGASAPSNEVVPWSGAGYHAVDPVRILDSRPPSIGFIGPVTSAQPRRLQVTGLGGPSNVPASATAVVMNVTVTDSTTESFLTVYPTGSPKPNASNLNFGAGQVIPNLVTVKLGDSGAVDIATAVGTTNVVADVMGYYDDGLAPGDLFVPVEPVRLLDSRVPGGQWEYRLHENETKPLMVRSGFIEDDNAFPWLANAIVVNITVTGSDAPSFLTVRPHGAPGNISNLNFQPGQTIANLAVVGVEDNAWFIDFSTEVGSVDVIVDLVGYFQPFGGSYFHAMDPNRVLDTRFGPGPTGKVTAGETRVLPVAGAAGTNVPAGATGLVANVTVADATAESFVAVFPGDVARPDPFSNVNFGINQVIPSLSTVGVAPNGSVKLYNHLGQTHLIADAVGWYAPW